MSTLHLQSTTSKVAMAVAAAVGFLASVGGVVALWKELNPEIRSFESEFIYFNDVYPENDKLISFLERNDGRTVKINTQFDFSPVLPEHYKMLHDCNNAYPLPDQEERDFLRAGGNYKLIEGHVYNVDIELPHTVTSYDGAKKITRQGCDGMLQIRLNSNKTSGLTTHGGVGFNFVRVRGTFDVHHEVTGANDRFILTEVTGR